MIEIFCATDLTGAAREAAPTCGGELGRLVEWKEF
jgi:hypothetical protein